ncbi:MAG: alpha/beta fold hydrolase [Cyclobacteriaceae bacterium]
MPLVKRSTYRSRPFYMINGHLETVIPSMFFKIEGVTYRRERLELSDGDFLDLDWSEVGSKRLLVITHGLEGSSDRYYVKRSVKYFNERGWDVLAWNCRSCSGEMNRLPRLYHHGDTADLDTVINQSLEKDYDELWLLGYSMGGSMSFKYLGELKVDDRIRGAIGFSVPCNLRDSGEQLRIKRNRIYEKKFLDRLKIKMHQKAKMGIDIDVNGLDEMEEFDEFHHKYTVPLHGFSSLDDFYEKATCDQYLTKIDRPILIANALNDPILGEKCYPVDLAQANEHIHLDLPNVGGHCGFSYFQKWYSWMEVRTEQFIKSQT